MINWQNGTVKIRSFPAFSLYEKDQGELCLHQGLCPFLNHQYRPRGKTVTGFPDPNQWDLETVWTRWGSILEAANTSKQYPIHKVLHGARHGVPFPGVPPVAVVCVR